MADVTRRRTRNGKFLIDAAVNMIAHATKALGLSGILLVCVAAGCATTSDPLPSWIEGLTKTQILDFVAAVTDEGGSDYVEIGEVQWPESGS